MRILLTLGASPPDPPRARSRGPLRSPLRSRGSLTGVRSRPSAAALRPRPPHKGPDRLQCRVHPSAGRQRRQALGDRIAPVVSSGVNRSLEMIRHVRRWSVVGAAILIVLSAVTIPAQQMVTETRNPAQAQDEDFARRVKEWTTQPHFISPLVDHLPKVTGATSPKDVPRLPHRRASQAHVLCGLPQVLPSARGGAPRPREGRVDWQVGRGSRARRGLGLLGREHPQPPEKPREPGENCRSAGTVPGSDQPAHRDDETALSPDGGPPQRRNGPFGNADGARLPAGDRNLSARHADSRERHRVDHARRGP